MTSVKGIICLYPGFPFVFEMSRSANTTSDSVTGLSGLGSQGPKQSHRPGLQEYSQAGG